ncbi:MAG: diacylglycerol kinase family protein [Chloroflexi bacterium]|nr:diacylglycerol kinase family protein [Chloroflexota bacterium]
MSRPVAPSPELSPPYRTKRSFWRSLHVALAGAGCVLRTERNAQIESGIALLAIGLGLWLRITRQEWAVIFTLITLVLGLEMVNTAIEAAVDLACPEQNPLAKKTKDSAAGAVVVAAIGSVAVGLVIFLPRLWPVVMHWLNL